jgi:hypothetical protein
MNDVERQNVEILVAAILLSAPVGSYAQVLMKEGPKDVDPLAKVAALARDLVFRFMPYPERAVQTQGPGTLQGHPSPS